MASKIAELKRLSLPTSVLCIWETSATMKPRTKLAFKNIHLTSSTRKINLQNAGKLIISKENPGTTTMVTTNAPSKLWSLVSKKFYFGIKVLSKQFDYCIN
ncbi:UNVERIFIED_CONTAM: hypothetical protein K2H54_008129 [Gekko kuhli]